MHSFSVSSRQHTNSRPESGAWLWSVLLYILLLTSAIGSAASPHKAKEKAAIKIGVLAKRGEEKALQQWSPTADYLNWMLPNLHFQIVPLDFDAIYPAAANKEIDFILTNSAFYVALVYHHQAQRILTIKNKRLDQETTRFGGVIFTRADNNTINTLNYRPVRQCLQSLRFPPFENYNIISWQESVRQHWPWYVFIVVVIIMATLSTITFFMLNRRLHSTMIQLNDESTNNRHLARHLQKFKLTLDQTMDCVFMYAPETLKYIYANQGAVNQVGYSRRELLTMPPLDLKPALTEKEFRAILDPLVREKKESITYTTTHLTKDGYTIPVEIIQQYVELSKEKNRFVSIVRDISSNHLAEIRDKELLQSQLLQAISESRNGVSRVSSIVMAMKKFSHPGSKTKETQSLNAIINTTVTVARNEWKYVADMERDLDPDLPRIPLLADEMGQVILNMLVNAAHAIDERLGDNPDGNMGKITISTQADHECVELRITDTGTGMSEDVKSRIFDPFYTTKKVGKGSGQGLAISHDVIVEKHRGTVTVESVVNESTTFIIRLPLVRSQVDE